MWVSFSLNYCPESLFLHSPIRYTLAHLFFHRLRDTWICFKVISLAGRIEEGIPSGTRESVYFFCFIPLVQAPPLDRTRQSPAELAKVVNFRHRRKNMGLWGVEGKVWKVIREEKRALEDKKARRKEWERGTKGKGKRGSNTCRSICTPLWISMDRIFYCIFIFIY